MNKKGREVEEKDIVAEATSNMVEGGWSSFYDVMSELFELDPDHYYFKISSVNDEDFCDRCEDEVGFVNLTKLKDEDHFVCKECLAEISE